MQGVGGLAGSRLFECSVHIIILRFIHEKVHKCFDKLEVIKKFPSRVQGKNTLAPYITMSFL